MVYNDTTNVVTFGADIKVGSSGSIIESTAVDTLIQFDANHIGLSAGGSRMVDVRNIGGKKLIHLDGTVLLEGNELTGSSTGSFEVIEVGGGMFTSASLAASGGSGATGADGTSGVAGNSADSGSSGTTGTDGTSGNAGNSATSGTDGTSG